jgi:hypothetical protein
MHYGTPHVEERDWYTIEADRLAQLGIDAEVVIPRLFDMGYDENSITQYLDEKELPSVPRETTYLPPTTVAEAPTAIASPLPVAQQAPTQEGILPDDFFEIDMTIKDTGTRMLIGVNHILAGPTWLIEQIGKKFESQPLIDFARQATQSIDRNNDVLLESLSEAARRDLGQALFKMKDENAWWPEQVTGTAGQFLGAGAEALGSTAPMLGAGGVFTKILSKIFPKWKAANQAMVGFGGSEAIFEGSSVGKHVYEIITTTPPDIVMQSKFFHGVADGMRERGAKGTNAELYPFIIEELGQTAARDAGVSTGAVVGVTLAPFSRLLGRLGFGTARGATRESVSSAFFKGLTYNAGQEYFQEGYSAIMGNYGEWISGRPTSWKRGVGGQALEAAAAGGLVGGLVGSGVHTATELMGDQQPTVAQPPPLDLTKEKKVDVVPPPEGEEVDDLSAPEIVVETPVATTLPAQTDVISTWNAEQEKLRKAKPDTVSIGDSNAEAILMGLDDSNVSSAYERIRNDTSAVAKANPILAKIGVTKNDAELSDLYKELEDLAETVPATDEWKKRWIVPPKGEATPLIGVEDIESTRKNIEEQKREHDKETSEAETKRQQGAYEALDFLASRDTAPVGKRSAAEILGEETGREQDKEAVYEEGSKYKPVWSIEEYDQLLEDLHDPIKNPPPKTHEAKTEEFLKNYPDANQEVKDLASRFVDDKTTKTNKKKFLAKINKLYEPKVEPVVAEEPDADVTPEVKADVTPEVKADVTPEVKADVTPEVKADITPEAEEEVVTPEVKAEETAPYVPLIKVHSKPEKIDDMWHVITDTGVRQNEYKLKKQKKAFELIKLLKDESDEGLAFADEDTIKETVKQLNEGKKVVSQKKLLDKKRRSERVVLALMNLSQGSAKNADLFAELLASPKSMSALTNGQHILDKLKKQASKYKNKSSIPKHLNNKIERLSILIDNWKTWLVNRGGKIEPHSDLIDQSIKKWQDLVDATDLRGLMDMAKEREILAPPFVNVDTTKMPDTGKERDNLRILLAKKILAHEKKIFKTIVAQSQREAKEYKTLHPIADKAWKEYLETHAVYKKALKLKSKESSLKPLRVKITNAEESLEDILTILATIRLNAIRGKTAPPKSLEKHRIAWNFMMDNGDDVLFVARDNTLEELHVAADKIGIEVEKIGKKKLTPSEVSKRKKAIAEQISNYAVNENVEGDGYRITFIDISKTYEDKEDYRKKMTSLVNSYAGTIDRINMGDIGGLVKVKDKEAALEIMLQKANATLLANTKRLMDDVHSGALYSGIDPSEILNSIDFTKRIGDRDLAKQLNKYRKASSYLTMQIPKAQVIEKAPTDMYGRVVGSVPNIPRDESELEAQGFEAGLRLADRTIEQASNTQAALDEVTSTTDINEIEGLVERLDGEKITLDQALAEESMYKLQLQEEALSFVTDIKFVQSLPTKKEADLRQQLDKAKTKEEWNKINKEYLAEGKKRHKRDTVSEEKFEERRKKAIADLKVVTDEIEKLTPKKPKVGIPKEEIKAELQRRKVIDVKLGKLQDQARKIIEAFNKVATDTNLKQDHTQRITRAALPSVLGNEAAIDKSWAARRKAREENKDSNVGAVKPTKLVIRRKALVDEETKEIPKEAISKSAPKHTVISKSIDQLRADRKKLLRKKKKQDVAAIQEIDQAIEVKERLASTDKPLIIRTTNKDESVNLVGKGFSKLTYSHSVSKSGVDTINIYKVVGRAIKKVDPLTYGFIGTPTAEVVTKGEGDPTNAFDQLPIAKIVIDEGNVEVEYHDINVKKDSDSVAFKLVKSDEAVNMAEARAAVTIAVSDVTSAYYNKAGKRKGSKVLGNQRFDTEQLSVVRSRDFSDPNFSKSESDAHARWVAGGGADVKLLELTTDEVIARQLGPNPSKAGKAILTKRFAGYKEKEKDLTAHVVVESEAINALKTKLENTIKSIKKTTKKGGFLKWDSLTKKALSLEGEIMTAERAKIDIYPFADDTVRKQVPTKEMSELEEDEKKNPKKTKELTEPEKRTQIELAYGDELHHFKKSKTNLDEANRFNCPGK